MTEDQILECIKLYESGKTIVEVANIVGVRKDIVYRGIRNRTNMRKSGKEGPNETQILECVELYEKGFSLEKIGKLFGFSIQTIHNNIRNLTEMRKASEKIFDEEQIEKCVSLYENGKSLKYIGELMGVSQTTVNSYIKDKIKIRKPYKETYFNEEHLLEFIKLYEDGKTLKQISKLTGFEKNFIHEKIRNIVSMRPAVKRFMLDEKQIDCCYDLYLNGKTMIEISKEFDCIYSTVSRAIKRLKNVKITTNKLNKEQIIECIRRYEEEESLKGLSKEFNVSKSCLEQNVKKIIKLNGIKKQTKILRKNEINITNMFLEGNSLNKIAREFKVSSASVGKIIIKQFGKRKFNISEEDIKKSVELYLNRKNIREISEIIGKSESCIYWNLLRQNIKMRPVEEAKKNKDINHDFFGKYTKESCYWAGFIAADGNLKHKNINGYNLSIELSRKDEVHLLKFVKEINFKNKIYYRERLSKKGEILKMICVIYSSKQNYYNLINYFDLSEAKSLTMGPPNNIPEEYLRHYIRGYFDGDGCVVNNIKHPQISICGTESFLNWVKDNFKKHCSGVGNPAVRSLKDNKIHVLSFGGRKQTVSILDWLYKETEENIKLDRKYNLYIKYMESQNNEYKQIPTSH
jgi:DNA-binding CsgD family transcriptional regulator